MTETELYDTLRHIFEERDIPFPEDASIEELTEILKALPDNAERHQKNHEEAKNDRMAATTLSGLLIGVKLDHNNMGKLVWATIPREEAIQRGMKPEHYDILYKLWESLDLIQYQLGGQHGWLDMALALGCYNLNSWVRFAPNANDTSLTEILGMNPAPNETEPITLKEALDAAEEMFEMLGESLSVIEFPEKIEALGFGYFVEDVEQQRESAAPEMDSKPETPIVPEPEAEVKKDFDDQAVKDYWYGFFGTGLDEDDEVETHEPEEELKNTKEAPLKEQAIPEAEKQAPTHPRPTKQGKPPRTPLQKLVPERQVKAVDPTSLPDQIEHNIIQQAYDIAASGKLPTASSELLSEPVTTQNISTAHPLRGSP